MEERREIAVIQNPKKDQYSYLQDPGIQKTTRIYSHGYTIELYGMNQHVMRGVEIYLRIWSYFHCIRYDNRYLSIHFVNRSFRCITSSCKCYELRQMVCLFHSLDEQFQRNRDNEISSFCILFLVQIIFF